MLIYLAHTVIYYSIWFMFEETFFLNLFWSLLKS